jgi:putative phosphoribosyl transferase
VVVCPLQPRHFVAVGGWYEHFDQVPDKDVVRLLDL